MTREICRPYWNQSGYEPLNSENVLCKGVEATERTLGRLSAMFFPHFSPSFTQMHFFLYKKVYRKLYYDNIIVQQ